MSKQPIFFRHDRVLKKLNIDEILALEAAINYVIFYVYDGQRFMVRTTLEAALSQMPAKRFLRVHRSYAVSVDYIDKIDKESVYLRDYIDVIPVSKQHYPEIVKQITILDAVSPKKKKSAGDEKNEPSLILRRAKKNGQR